MKEDQKIKVLKLNLQQEVIWDYSGKISGANKNIIIIEAYFDREDMYVEGMPLLKGDRFVETYYTDRWYNILEIHARENDALRGWYCNISYPAELEGPNLSYVDLALDLIVFPDGHQIVIDREEFNSLPLSDDNRGKALKALTELQDYFRKMIAKN